jgi:Na+-driven multidrug efflux pump
MAARAAARKAVRTASAQPVAIAPLLRRIFALAAPTGLLAALQVVAQLIEIWLASRQGMAAFAGWAVVLPFAQLMQQMSTGAMGGGVASAIARALGAGRRDEASALVVHASLIAVVAGAAFGIVLAGFPAEVLGAVAGPEVAQAASGYAIWLFGAGAAPVWLANTFASVLRGGGRHALAARILALTWAGCPLLGWLLAEPLGMGLAGLGAGFALAFWGAALAMAAAVWRGEAGFAPGFRVRPSRPLFNRILSVGLVACGLAAIANLTTILVTAQVAAYGAAAVAAFGIAARLEFLVIPAAFSVGSALTALVGHAVGAGDWATARRIAWTGAWLVFAATGAAGLAVALAPTQFAGLFSGDPEVVSIAARALSFTGLAFGMFGLGMALYFASMGAGRMRWPVLAALSRIGLAVGGGWLLAEPAGMGLDGYFLGVALGIAAYGLVTAIGVRPGAWTARAPTARAPTGAGRAG